jgi:asparagine synthetase B (glutamine-hydrolysing)
MSHFFAVYGQEAKRAHEDIAQALGKVYNYQQTDLNSIFSSECCVLVASKSSELGINQDASESNPYIEQTQSLASDIVGSPLLLHSRLPKEAFLKANTSVLSGKTILDLAQVLHRAQSVNDNTKSLAKTFAQLEGDFRCVWLNPENQELVLAVSAFNPQTLFYGQLPQYSNTYLVSSNIQDLLTCIEPDVDLCSLSMWLSGRPDPNRSMYTNIHQVAQATILTLANVNKGDGDFVGHHSTKFWDITTNTLSAEQLQKGQSSAVREKLHANIQQSVALYAQSTQADGIKSQNTSLFTQLSGGMDSTTVSAMAFKAMPDANKQLHSISHTYANTESCDETNNISAMIERYPFAKSHFIELDKYSEMSFAQLYPTHPQSPGMVLSPKYHEEAKLLKACGASALLTGNGGDEMFWGHSFAYYDRLKEGDFKVVPEVIKGARELNVPVLQALRSVFVSPCVHYDILPMLQFGTRRKAKIQANKQASEQIKTTPLMQKLVARNMHLPNWLSEKATQMVSEQQYAMAGANPFINGKHGLTRYARYDGLFNTSTFNSMRSYQAVFEQYGLNVHHPLFDKRIAEFSFAIPQHLQISGKYPKLLLRQAMNDELPEQVCWNSHKTVFDQHFAKLVQQNQTALRKLLEHEGLQNLGLLNNNKLLESFDKLVQSANPSLNVDLLYAILVQSWYQTHILKI